MALQVIPPQAGLYPSAAKGLPQAMRERIGLVTYYVRDAQGNVMATYERSYESTTNTHTFTLVEQPIYGSSRLGMRTESVDIYSEIAGASGGGSVDATPSNLKTRTLGNKSLVETTDSNHLESRKQKTPSIAQDLFVAPLGLEPRLTVPKTAVLPIRRWGILVKGAQM